ncbi:hypothetical protein [Streptomyces sp. G1]|uniref:hypothetical protein n=1 Tax=Streptomyces sp. G1 TaxID=361572 RepID=UPI00202FA236|nr:hypothetical protein [Streptomyces sp. G1]MCM1976487.1 hypothetical protein [Streptomyces sp. G1]
MNKILSRAFSAAAVAGIATLAAAGPALADPAPGGLIGSQLEVIGLASQNSAVPTGESISHPENSQNSAHQAITDAQAIDALKNVDVMEKPLILV